MWVRPLVRRETDVGPFRVAPIDKRYMADVLDEPGLRLFAQAVDETPALLAIGSIHAHLQELVMIQCPSEFLAHGAAQAGIANDDDRCEFVAEGAQPALLRLREWHSLCPRDSRSIPWRAPRAADAG